VLASPWQSRARLVCKSFADKGVAKTLSRKRFKEKPYRLADVLKRLGVGMFVTLLLVLLQSLVEKTSLGHKAKILTYEFLQGQLSPFSSEERLPILVVDISNIPGGKDQPTPRETLRAIIEEMARQGAKAVAVDVDFSPNEDGWITDDDPKFFDFCLKLGRDGGVPVYLGVYRRRTDTSEAWLGLDKYKELAAAVAIQRDDVSRMARWVQSSGVPERLPTLSAALAETYQRSLPGPPKWLEGAVEITNDNLHGVERQIGEIRFAEAPVNYSKLEQIEHETLTTISPTSVAEAGELFRGRMVLLGDATRFTDPFNVPGRARPVGGVYLQACAAYTLAIEPLYEFRARARLVLDLTISLLILFCVEWARLCHTPKGGSFPQHIWQARFIWGAIALVTLTGIILIRCLSIMWLDFLLVVFALLLHPSVEHRLGDLWEKLKGPKPATRPEA
jgi:CHASE2 domain-containing sensor protein